LCNRQLVGVKTPEFLVQALVEVVQLIAQRVDRGKAIVGLDSNAFGRNLTGSLNHIKVALVILEVYCN
jgi:hypothetical protein